MDRFLSMERNRLIRDLYLACYTQEQIAEKVGLKQTRIAEIISLIEKFQLPIQSCENDEEKQIAEQKIRTQRILGQLIKEGQEKGEYWDISQ